MVKTRFLQKIPVGGGGGIRTHGPLKGSTVFETVPIDHSGTPPRGIEYLLRKASMQAPVRCNVKDLLKRAFADVLVAGLPELKKLLYTTCVEECTRVTGPGAGN
jgi:hypothetical protein